MTQPHELTARQLAVAALVARCYPNKRIAAELDIGERRVRVLITSIAYRIGADPSLNERLQVAQWWDAHFPREEPVQHGPRPPVPIR